MTAGVYAHVRLRLQRQVIDSLGTDIGPTGDEPDGPPRRSHRPLTLPSVLPSNAREPPPITDSAGAPSCARVNSETLGNFLFGTPGTLAAKTGCARRGYKFPGTPFPFFACQPPRT